MSNTTNMEKVAEQTFYSVVRWEGVMVTDRLGVVKYCSKRLGLCEVRSHADYESACKECAEKYRLLSSRAGGLRKVPEKMELNVLYLVSIYDFNRNMSIYFRKLGEIVQEDCRKIIAQKVEEAKRVSSQIDGTQNRPKAKVSPDKVIHTKNKNLIDETPLVSVCKAIMAEIEEEYLPVVALGTKMGTRKDIVLEDDNYYYVRQADALAMVNHYESVNGFPSRHLSSTDVARLLADKEIISVYQEGKSKRFSKKVSGYNVRFMTVNKEKLQEHAGMR